MSYSVKEQNGRKIISGSYIPNGFSCKCKTCNYTIEVLKETSKEDIETLVKIIEGK